MLGAGNLKARGVGDRWLNALAGAEEQEALASKQVACAPANDDPPRALINM